MTADDERLPPAYGCGWRYGEEAGCAILSCRRKNPCEGEWADDIYRIIKAGAGLSTLAPFKAFANKVLIHTTREAPLT